MTGSNFNPVSFILAGVYMLCLVTILMYGGRILDIIERAVFRDRPASPAGRAGRRGLRRYLPSPEFWIGGILIGMLFFGAGLIVQCGWFRR